MCEIMRKLPTFHRLVVSPFKTKFKQGLDLRLLENWE